MKKYFITGLVTLLPLTVTIAVVVFIVNLLTKPFIGMVTNLLAHTKISKFGFLFLSPEQLIRYLSQFLILISLFLLILALGFVARLFLFNALVKLGDKIIKKIPLVNKVYKTSQEIVQSLFITEKESFKQVVLAPFPLKEAYALGLVSKKSPKTCRDKLKSDLISVFIPTTPNPTTGYLLMFDKKDLIFLKMKTEEAIKYVVSCGMIIPKEKRKITKK